MKSTLLKDGIKEIKKSYKRFISILLIVLLGVGFFAGLKATSPDMKKTLDTYFDKYDVMDVQLISTLGLTDEDIVAIKSLDNVDKVEGTYQTDAVVTIENETVVVKLETITNELNKLELVEGRMPEQSNECVVETNFLSNTGHSIGDSIKIEVEDIENETGEKQKVLKNEEVTIVGTVNSPLYISTERGSTELGSGKVNYYMYIEKENINVEMYTNIYLTVSDAKELDTTSDEYSEKVDAVINSLENISEERRQARYDELYDSVNAKIIEAEQQLNEQKSLLEEELQSAEQELNNAKQQIEDAKNELESNRKKAESEFSVAEQEIENARDQLKQQKEIFENTKSEVTLQIQQYQSQLETLQQTQNQLQSLQSSLSIANQNLESLNQKLENASDNEKENIQAEINIVNIQIQTLQESINYIQSELTNQGINNLDDTITTLESGITQAIQELESGERQLESAESQIESSQKQLQSTKNSTYYQLNQAEEEIAEKEAQISDAEIQLEQTKQEYNTQIQDAEEQLLEAKEELKQLQRPEWFILDRNQNTGYVSYLQDTDRISNLAQVFPVVFFLIAALMSLNSMTRMVEEERVQIGTLKALGYNKMQIMIKYILYASLATIVGGIIGLLIGFGILPKVIGNIYAMIYELPPIILEFNIKYATMGMVFAIIATVGATIYTCEKELRANPATLMRPKAPKPGKRVLLEKIPLIWKHLNFTAKVTARNLFRYKKRFLMTIIGVCGCTSLIIAGFGLRDAITSMIPMQYGQIDKYNISVSLSEEFSSDELQEIKDNILTNEEIISVIGANIQSVTIDKDDNNQSIQLIVPENTNNLDDFITLRERENKQETYVLDDSGVIITEKLAKLLDIEEGDVITLENSKGDRADVQVSHITENYIMHYLYMSPNLYNEVYDTKVGSNVILAKTSQLDENQEEQLGKILLQDEENITGVSFTSESSEMFATVMENMDMVVWILIIAAGLLALVVLYSLLNANISERLRELATIKVLGFYDKEVYSYIGRETIILTVLGILVGLIGGKYLTMYIIKTCEIDMLMFDPEIRMLSYVLGVVITVFFAVIVNIVTYYSLKKIDMIESLKSVE